MIKKWCRWIGRETSLKVKGKSYKGMIEKTISNLISDRDYYVYLRTEEEIIYISKRSVRANKSGLTWILDTDPKIDIL